MEAGGYGLTRGTSFLVYRLELDAVAGLLWISWCVLGGADFFSVFFFPRFFFFERTRPAASMRPPCLIYLSTSNEAVFALRRKSLFIPGCVQGAIISLVCVSVSACVTFVVI